MKFNSISEDPLQGSYFLHKIIGHSCVRRHKEFKCCFAFQYMRNLIPTQKLYPNRKLYPFLKHILSVFRFACLLSFSRSVDEKNICF